MKAKMIFKTLRDLFLVVAFLLTLTMPDALSATTKEALIFCTAALIPSLFTCNVLAKAVTGTVFFRKASEKFGATLMFILLGMLCGSPVCAKSAYDMYKNGEVDKKTAEYICSFSSGASLPFLIGFIGEGLFGSAYYGIRLALYQLTGMLISAAVTKFLIFGKEKIAKIHFTSRTTLTSAITESAYTMLTVCASAVFFISFGGMLVSFIGTKEEAGLMLRSVLEFSSGCKLLSHGPDAFKRIAFTVGHGGIAAMMQIFGVTEGKLDMRPFIIGKITECTVITLLAVVFG